MYTHSQLIDGLVEELLRPDLQAAMSNYLNQSIRELHFTAEAIPIGFSGNLGEDLLTADVENGFTYDLENPTRYQMTEAVFYATFNRYATMRRPSSMKQFIASVDGSEYGYYRSGDTLIFDNYGGIGSQIAVAWFDFIQRQKYYPVGERPCEWDEDTESFKYNTVGDTNYNSTPALQAQARFLCTNWMIQRWWDMLAQGVRAKTWGRLNDDTRSKTAYSSFESFRPRLIAAETLDYTPRYRS